MPPNRRSQGSPALSRSAIACITCRAKKQKCGGEKPVCAHCRKLSTECVWPEQKKRGPATGYVDALEARLCETETLLRRILAVSSEDLIRHALSQPNLYPVSVSSSGISKSSAAEKRKLVDSWNQHPLRTINDIHKWHGNFSVEELPPNSNSEGGLVLLKLPENGISDNSHCPSVQATEPEKESEYRDYSTEMALPRAHDFAARHINAIVKSQKRSNSTVIPESLSSEKSSRRAPELDQNYTREYDSSPCADLKRPDIQSGGDILVTSNVEAIQTRKSKGSSSTVGAKGMGFSKAFKDNFLW